MPNSLFVCYIPGLDLRHVGAANTPYLFSLLDSYPSVKLNGYTCSELLPAILTGTYPRDHGKYQVSIKSGAENNHSHMNGAGESLVDKLPDVVSTTVQGLMSLVDRDFDLPGIPPRRRRMLDLDTRFKFYARNKNPQVLMNIGGLETIFNVTGMGENLGSYRFTMEFRKLESMLNEICQGRHSFEFFEIHSLDIIQLWYSDQPDKVGDFYRHMDDFLKKLHAQCIREDTRLVILSDRALEPIVDSIDLLSVIRELPVDDGAYSYFIEPPMARFWFHDNAARNVIIDALSAIPQGSVLTYQDMEQHNLRLGDGRFGDIFFVANAGVIIFPHDFYNPIGNFYLGLTDWKQRPRLKSPSQRAVHGYLPHTPGEVGFTLVCDKDFEAAISDAKIVDVAPTLLSMLGSRIPDHMQGQNFFRTAKNS